MAKVSRKGRKQRRKKLTSWQTNMKKRKTKKKKSKKKASKRGKTATKANKLEQKRLQGSWKMRSYTTKAVGKKEKLFCGERYHGRLIYLGNRVCSCVTGKLIPYKKLFQTDAFPVGSPKESQQNMKRLICYSGGPKI